MPDYFREYRMRPEVKERDRLRARRRRALPGGAELNRQRVKAWRASPRGRNLLREYQRLTALIGSKHAVIEIPELLQLAMAVDAERSKNRRKA